MALTFLQRKQKGDALTIASPSRPQKRDWSDEDIYSVPITSPKSTESIKNIVKAWTTSFSAKTSDCLMITMMLSRKITDGTATKNLIPQLTLMKSNTEVDLDKRISELMKIHDKTPETKGTNPEIPKSDILSTFPGGSGDEDAFSVFAESAPASTTVTGMTTSSSIESFKNKILALEEEKHVTAVCSFYAGLLCRLITKAEESVKAHIDGLSLQRLASFTPINCHGISFPKLSLDFYTQLGSSMKGSKVNSNSVLIPYLLAYKEATDSKNEDSMAYLRYLLLTSTCYNGCNVISLGVQIVEKRKASSLTELLTWVYNKETAATIDKLAFIAAEYTKDNTRSLWPWARAISDSYLQEFTSADNIFLLTLLAATLEQDITKGPWNIPILKNNQDSTFITLRNRAVSAIRSRGVARVDEMINDLDDSSPFKLASASGINLEDFPDV